jgi:transcriptional regulator of acetoin/glycerol metabolism
MERVLFTCKKDSIDTAELMLTGANKVDNTESLEDPTLSLDEIERKSLIKRLKFHRGNATETAKSLGLSRSGYYRRLSKYELD